MTFVLISTDYILLTVDNYLIFTLGKFDEPINLRQTKRQSIIRREIENMSSLQRNLFTNLTFKFIASTQRDQEMFIKVIKSNHSVFCFFIACTQIRREYIA